MLSEIIKIGGNLNTTAKVIRFFLLSALLFTTSSVYAINGLFIPGYGAKSLGVCGAITAFPQDAFISTINPAGINWIQDQAQADALFFFPSRGYSYTNFGGDHVRSHAPCFLVPFLAYKRDWTDCLAYGVSMYGAGGLNTSYHRNNPVFGTKKRMGIDYVQLVVAPTLSYGINCNHSIGVSLLLGGQRIKVQGLDGFEAFSIHPNRVSGKGYSYCIGAGGRIGWLGKLTDHLWAGASYSSKIYCTRFNKYKGLFAGGRINIPANFSVGIRYEVTPCLNVMFDTQCYFFRNVRSIGNSIQRIFDGPRELGKSNGPGFGWRNLWVYKVGLAYQPWDCLTLRLGYSAQSRLFSDTQMDPNIVAPTVGRYHYTAGFTWQLSERSEFSGAYMYAQRGSQRGESQFGLGTVRLWTYQHAFSLNYGWLF